MAKKLFWLFLLLVQSGPDLGSGSRFDSSAQRTVQGLLAPIPGATIVVCTSAGTGTPCSPTAPIYLDSGLTQLISGSTLTADSQGNFGFWAAPGTYTYSITATGVTGKLFTVVLPINLASNNTLTGSNTFSQQIVSTVTTGTAPFSIASTTVIPNLNAQLHNGLSAPATGAIAGVATGNSSATNFGVALSTQTIVASVPTTGTFAIFF